VPLVLMQDVTTERLHWLWRGYILFGKLTMLDGDGGLGKSTLMLDLAARLSRGRPMPDGSRHAPAGTLLLMAEDGAGDTIKPRLENAGADMSRIGLLQTYTDPADNLEVMPTLPDDLSIIETAIYQVEAKLLVIDPILSYIGDNVNEYRDKEVRRALAPVIAMAERTGVALVCLRHITKTIGGNAKHRGNASVAFTNMSRSALFVAQDPDDQTRMVLAQSKGNLGPPAPSLTYRLVGCENEHARVNWEGTSMHTANSLSAQGGSDEERSELRDAEAFLLDVLEGGPLLVEALKKQAREAGIAEATLRRAKVSLRIDSQKARTQDGKWVWVLPPKGDPPTPTNDHVEDDQNGHTPALITLNPLITFHKSIEDDQDDHGDQHGDTSNVIAFKNLPTADHTGPGYTCCVCQAPIRYVLAGKPLLCIRHREMLRQQQLAAD
jgi:hypothetical protein